LRCHSSTQPIDARCLPVRLPSPADPKEKELRQLLRQTRCSVSNWCKVHIYERSTLNYITRDTVVGRRTLFTQTNKISSMEVRVNAVQSLAQGVLDIEMEEIDDRCRLDRLPSEILELIAAHLRAIPSYSPSDDPRECPCQRANSTNGVANETATSCRSGNPMDSSLALSAACRRLREICFTNRLERKSAMGYCAWCRDRARGVSADTRRNVK
jgi:hypothetical protein